MKLKLTYLLLFIAGLYASSLAQKAITIINPVLFQKYNQLDAVIANEVLQNINQALATDSANPKLLFRKAQLLAHREPEKALELYAYCVNYNPTITDFTAAWLELKCQRYFDQILSTQAMDKPLNTEENKSELDQYWAIYHYYGYGNEKRYTALKEAYDYISVILTPYRGIHTDRPTLPKSIPALFTNDTYKSITPLKMDTEVIDKKEKDFFEKERRGGFRLNDNYYLISFERFTRKFNLSAYYKIINQNVLSHSESKHPRDSMKYFVTKYTIFIVPKGKSARSFTVRGDTLPAMVKKELSNLVMGDRVIFDAVRASGPDGVRNFRPFITTCVDKKEYEAYLEGMDTTSWFGNGRVNDQIIKTGNLHFHQTQDELDDYLKIISFTIRLTFPNGEIYEEKVEGHVIPKSILARINDAEIGSKLYISGINRASPSTAYIKRWYSFQKCSSLKDYLMQAVE